MPHVYRVTVNRPQSILVKAESKNEARAFVANEVTVCRLDGGELVDAIGKGEKVYTAAASAAAQDADAE